MPRSRPHYREVLPAWVVELALSAQLSLFLSGLVAEAVEMKLISTQGLPTEFDQVFVVGEEKDLGALGQGAELRQDSPSAGVVECDQKIIQN